MADASIETKIESLGTFFAAVGLSPDQTERATNEVMDLAVEDFTLRLVERLPADTTKALVASGANKNGREKLLALWEVALPVVGDNEAARLFDNALKAMVDAYLASMQGKLPKNERN